jgi:hypothetical protein
MASSFVSLYFGDEKVGAVRQVPGRITRWGVRCETCRTALVDTAPTQEGALMVLAAHLFEHDNDAAAA